MNPPRVTMNQADLPLYAVPVHGGPDMMGVPEHDLSTNANACGPYAAAEQAVRDAPARHYPDPAYTALTIQLGAWHGVAPSRIVIGASGSELIQRLTTAVALQALSKGQAASVQVPVHAYGDYARAAQAAGLALAAEGRSADLTWACDPSSPLGQAHDGLADQVARLQAEQTLVLDQAYDPLRLQGELALEAQALDRIWRLMTPNKALGLTGVRAAYAIAPASDDAIESALFARVCALAPSWPLGAHGVALLQMWATVDAHQWLQQSRQTLQAWKARQISLLGNAGWKVEPSVANFLVVSRQNHGMPHNRFDMTWLADLRRQGVKLRDCASFGLPGHARMAVVDPATQDALMSALSQALTSEAHP